MTADEAAVWRRVEDLWALTLTGEAERIRALLHPQYSGWEQGSARPHDREAAVRSVSGGPARPVSYALEPLGVRVYEGMVGVVHYRYSAVVPDDTGKRQVTGGWSEVYLKRDGSWLLISVAGRPDPPAEARGG